MGVTVFSRRITASLASCLLLTPAAAQECLWPAPEPAPAVEAAPAGVPVAPNRLPVQVQSGAAEVSQEGDALLTGGVTVRLLFVTIVQIGKTIVQLGDLRTQSS